MKLSFYLCVSFCFSQYIMLGQSNTFPPSGNVGIGITSPSFDLDVSKSGLPYIRIHNQEYTNSPTVLTRLGGIIFNQQYSDKTAGILMAVPQGYHVPGILFTTKTAWNQPGPGTTDWYDRMFIHPDGNVGIGTTSPDAKLSVKGTIHSQEVKVDLSGSVAPDYVFEKNYPLSSLPDLKTYIDQHKHLPEIPSAKQMKEEGINLKEMNLLLLKKVEELTLHVIEQNKQIEEGRVSAEASAKKVEELTVHVIELERNYRKQNKNN